MNIKTAHTATTLPLLYIDAAYVLELAWLLHAMDYICKCSEQTQIQIYHNQSSISMHWALCIYAACMHALELPQTL